MEIDLRDDAWSEMYVSGGTVENIEDAIPNLADFECNSCGQIGPHLPSCERRTMICKVDGCEEIAVQQRGPYGLLCSTHRSERRTEYDRRRHQNGHVETDDLVAELETAAAQAAPEFGVDDLVEAAKDVAAAAHEVERAQVKLDGMVERLRDLLGVVQAK